MVSATTRVAIVTGASGGIGSAVSKRLAADGFSLVLSYSGHSAKADEIVNSVKASGGQAIAVATDIANPDSVAQLFQQAFNTFGRLDVVINGAGIMPLAPIAKGDFDTFDKVIAVNLRGTYIVLSCAAQRLSEGGRIIVFSSSVLAKSFPNYGAYIASKAGVEGLMHVLTNELRGRGITVNAVAPGPIATDLFLHGKSEEVVNEFIKLSPLERLGVPEDVSGAVSFLCGPDGGWVNGQTLRVNGGFA